MDKGKDRGFRTNPAKSSGRKKEKTESQGRLISWSPWPPANFKTRYPAFPLVTTVLILIFLRWLTVTE